MVSTRHIRNNLIADLENAKYLVSRRPGKYGAEIQDVEYMWEGARQLAGTIVRTKRAIFLIAYPSQRSEEMEIVARLHCSVEREETAS